MKTIVNFLIAITVCNNLFALTKEEIDFFEKKIRPVLSESCYKCHSSKSEKVKGKLLLDNKSSTLKGGTSGPAVVPGDLDKSLLIKSIKYTDKDLQMPPSSKLSDSVIKDFETWVKMGAPDPRINTSPAISLDEKQTKEHWAYQRLNKPNVPAVNTKWVINPIDNFIYSKLRENDLSPSIEADKKILIRRLYFDLLGLPPSENDIDSFFKDTSKNAYEKLVDKLLDSPQYGERWGRHWMDTSRYSDTTGTVNANQEPRYTYSYTYRDYVIRAFNEDLPFDRFIKEQIAADKLPDIKKENLAALGFLTLGKNSNNNNDVIDDRIDVIFKGFMATTVVCARCHDHKFDPISTKDYYAIHGILNSTYVPSDKEKPVLIPIKDTPEYRDYLEKQNKIEQEIESFIDTRYASALLEFRTNTFKNLYGGYMLANVAESNRTDYIRDNALNSRMIQKWSSAINVKISVSRRQDLKGKDVKSKTSQINHPVFLPLARMFKVSEKDFKTEWSTVLSENKDDINPYLLHNIKKTAMISMKDLATAYQNAINESLVLNTNIEGIVEFKESIFKNNGPLDINRDNFQRFYADNGKTMRYDNELRAQRGKLITHELTHIATPPRAMVLIDKDKAADSPVLIKGDPGTRGAIVPRRFLETFNYLNSNNFTNGSGRLELANAIANSDNPLTVRVIVNRLWQFHFGEGLSRSPDDFGIQTEKPVLNDLLNYLSVRFMEEGWSIKKMTRLMLTSATYRQVSINDAKKSLKDPYNRFYWRMNTGRIDFETLRDTILYVGGKLDLKMGGQSVNLVSLNNNSEYSHRRTVYGLIDRGRLPEFFTTFDFATPEMTTGKRFQTTVPKQALFLMNNAMVIEQVRNMITRPEFIRIISEEEKIKTLYKICFQREPNPLEIKIGLRYMEDAMKEDMTDVKKEYNWKYGYRVTSANKTLSPFFEFNKFEKDIYSSTNDYFKGMTITRGGGTLPPNQNFFLDRQWNSPRKGSFEIKGTFSSKSIKGQSDTVLHVYKNSKPLKSFNVIDGKEISIELTIDLEVGDKLDFLTSNISKTNKDFTLNIKINELKDENSLTPITWNSNTDFKAPISKNDKELNSWERYAHVLMMSNEMIFIN